MLNPNHAGHGLHGASSRKSPRGSFKAEGLQKCVLGSNGFVGANSPVRARSCNSQGDAPAWRAATSLSGSTGPGRTAEAGELLKNSVAVHSAIIENVELDDVLVRVLVIEAHKTFRCSFRVMPSLRRISDAVAGEATSTGLAALRSGRLAGFIGL